MSREITCPKGKIYATKEEEDDDITFAFDRIKHVTPKSVLFEVDGDKYWVPTSQIVDVYVSAKEARISEWIATVKGLS